MSDFKKKWDNYWYHNKFKTFTILFILFLAVYTLFNYFGTQKPDIYITYAGSERNIEDLKAYLNEEFIEEIADINNDKKKIIEVMGIFTDREKISGDIYFWQLIDVDMVRGNSYIYILEDYVYSDFKNRGYCDTINIGGEEFEFIDIGSLKGLDNCLLAVRAPQAKGLGTDFESFKANSFAIINKILQII